MAGVSELPLLHKYVIRPQDDLQLVMTKLNYRLCVKQVSQVNYRRSLGSSISEAVDICELVPTSPSCTNTMSNAELMTRQVDPLVFSDDPECISSPKLLSPADSSYCGTMKSDDSGIVLDDSHNFSMTSEPDRDVELHFTSAEVSPLEEENDFVHSPEREVSVSPQSVDESPIKVVDLEKKPETNEAVEEFFRNSVNLEEDEHVEETKDEDVVVELEETSLNDTSPKPQEEFSESVHEEVTPNDDVSYHNDITNLQEAEALLRQPDDQSEELQEQLSEPRVTNEEEPLQEAEPEVVEEIIEKQTADEKLEDIQIDVPQQDEEQQEEKEEEERVDFVKEEEPEETNFDPGIKCDDAYTALDILKTKYRLSDTSVFRKFVITFSSWNVSQISHPIASGNRCSWWEDDIKEDELDEDDPQVDELMEQIYSRQGEISDLVDRIMEQEAEKIRAQEAAVEAASKPADKPATEKTPENVPEAIVPCEDVITPSQEPVPEIQSTPKDSDLKSAEKKKNRNALRRFIHAMRKRLRRNRPPSEANRKAT